MTKPFHEAFLRWLSEMDKLLVLRGFAAISVVIYHTQNYLRPNLHSNITLFGHDLTWLFVPDGKMPVVIFFTLSGYLMFKAFISRRYHPTLHGAWSFYKSRARRILPLYYFIAFVFLVFVTPKILFTAGYHKLLRDIFLFNYNGDPAFITPFWTLSVEVQFYILVPILVFVSLRWLPYKLLKALALLLIVIGANVLRTHFPGGIQPAVINLLTNIDAFLIGGAAAFVIPYLQEKIRIGRKTKGVLLLAAVVLGLSLLPLSALYVYKFSAWGYQTYGITLIATLTAIFITCAELSVTKAYAKRHYSVTALARRPWLIFEFLGAISYGIYLWHGPIVQQTFVMPISDAASVKESLLRAAVAVTVAAIFAYLTYKFVELYRSPNKNTIATTGKNQ